MHLNDIDQNYKSGYIKIYRSLKNHWIWGNDRKTKFEAWVDLLLMASHSGTKEPIGYDLIIVNEGQILTSQEKLGIQWRWDRNTVRKFLNMLESDRMIHQQTTSKYTMITICNYDSYQNKKPSKNPKSTNSATSTQHQAPTYNNDNNVNNVYGGDTQKIESEAFQKFNIWLNDKAHRVTLMKEQLTQSQFEKLMVEFDKVVVCDNLIAMHNWSDLFKRQTVNLTLRNFLSRDPRAKK